MTAPAGNMTWHHSERDENRNQSCDDYDQDDPSKDIDKGPGGDPFGLEVTDVGHSLLNRQTTRKMLSDRRLLSLHK